MTDVSFVSFTCCYVISLKPEWMIRLNTELDIYIGLIYVRSGKETESRKR